MRRKPKYLDRARRTERAMGEYWGGAQWSPTQRKDLEARAKEVPPLMFRPIKWVSEEELAELYPPS